MITDPDTELTVNVAFEGIKSIVTAFFDGKLPTTIILDDASKQYKLAMCATPAMGNTGSSEIIAIPQYVPTGICEEVGYCHYEPYGDVVGYRVCVNGVNFLLFVDKFGDEQFCLILTPETISVLRSHLRQRA